MNNMTKKIGAIGLMCFAMTGLFGGTSFASSHNCGVGHSHRCALHMDRGQVHHFDRHNHRFSKYHGKMHDMGYCRKSSVHDNSYGKKTSVGKLLLQALLTSAIDKL